MKKLFIIILALVAVSTTVLAATELTDVTTINNLGYYAYEQGDSQLAEKLFDKAISLDPTYEKARFNKAVLLNNQERYSEAMDELNLLTSLDANNVEYWYDLGVNTIASFRFVTNDIREFNEGIRAYEQAQESDANLAHIKENLEVLYRIRDSIQ